MIVSHVFVGTIEKIPREIVEHRAIEFVTNVYTRPEFRGRGIGGRALDAVRTARSETRIDPRLLVVWPAGEPFALRTPRFADRGNFRVRLLHRDPA